MNTKLSNPQQNVPLPSAGRVSNLFRTAKGESVSISVKAEDRTTAILFCDDDPANPATKPVVASGNSSTSSSSSSSFSKDAGTEAEAPRQSAASATVRQGFTTARGEGVSISQTSRDKVAKFWDPDNRQPQLAARLKRPRLSELMDDKENVDVQDKRPPPVACVPPVPAACTPPAAPSPLASCLEATPSSSSSSSSSFSVCAGLLPLTGEALDISFDTLRAFAVISNGSLESSWITTETIALGRVLRRRGVEAATASEARFLQQLVRLRARLQLLQQVTSETAGRLRIDSAGRLWLDPDQEGSGSLLQMVLTQGRLEGLDAESLAFLQHQVRWAVWCLASIERRRAGRLDEVLTVEGVAKMVLRRFAFYSHDQALLALYCQEQVQGAGTEPRAKLRHKASNPFASRASMSPLQRCSEICSLVLFSLTQVMRLPH